MQNDEFNSQNEYNQDLEIELGATPSSLKDLEVTENVDFSYDGYQVVRGEYFAHLFEPSVTFNRCKVYWNLRILSMSFIEYRKDKHYLLNRGIRFPIL